MTSQTPLTILIVDDSPEDRAVCRHFLSRHLVQTWIRTQRGKPTFQLASLAERLNVA